MSPVSGEPSSKELDPRIRLIPKVIRSQASEIIPEGSRNSQSSKANFHLQESILLNVSARGKIRVVLII